MIEEDGGHSEASGPSIVPREIGGLHTHPFLEELRPILASAWTRVGIVLLGLAAVAIPLGLPRTQAWAGLQTGLSMLVALRVLCAMRDPRDPLRNCVIPRGLMPAVAILLLFVWHWIAGAPTSTEVSGLSQPASASSGQDGLPDSTALSARPQAEPVADVRGLYNEQYWTTAVSDLHRLRFDQPQGKEPAHLFYEKRQEQLAAAVTTARRQIPLFVSDDVREAIDYHLTIDELVLEWATKVRNVANDIGVPADTTPTDEQIARTLAIFEELNEDDLRALPPKVQEVVTEAIALEELRLRQLEEVGILQKILRERFPGRQFSLPELNWEE